MSAKEKPETDFEIAFYEGILKRSPDYVDVIVTLAETYTRAGLYSKGLELDQKLARLRADDPVVHYNLACSLALTGDKEKALDALRKAIHLGYVDAVHMKKDPDLKSLREEPVFQELLRLIE